MTERNSEISVPLLWKNINFIVVSSVNVSIYSFIMNTFKSLLKANHDTEPVLSSLTFYNFSLAQASHI